MHFGIWPGVVDRDLVTLDELIKVPPEDPALAGPALDELAGSSERFYIRCYRNYGDGGTSRLPTTPADPSAYLGDRRVVDLVAGYAGADAADPHGFAQWVRQVVRDVAEMGGGKVQVCEEPNVAAPLDGGRPAVYEALAAGLSAAFDERDRLGADDVLVGFNAAAAAPNDSFWESVRNHVDGGFLKRADFIGLDFFPDVFRPIAASDLPRMVAALVTSFRKSARAIGVADDVPIHITETGWPTGPEHSEQEQARVLGTVASAVLGLADDLNIGAYELFGLRDGNSAGPRTNRFGLLRDDYTHKPAFDVIRDLANPDTTLR